MAVLKRTICITVVTVLLTVILCSCGKAPLTELSVKLDLNEENCQVFDVTVEYLIGDKTIYKASEKAASMPFTNETLVFLLPDEYIGDEENIKNIDVVFHLYDKEKGTIDMNKVKGSLKYGKAVKVKIKGENAEYSFAKP